MDSRIIGGKIAKARKDKSMSQAQVARLLFISPQAVGKWERGESAPDIVTFNRLAEIFGVDLNYFLESFTTLNSEVPLQPAEDNKARIPPSPQTAPLPVSGRQLLTNFSEGNHEKGDFAGVIAHKGRFEASTLTGADFSGADLTGSLFRASDTRAANFDGANLTDCRFSVLELAGSSFHHTTLVRTEFDKTGMAGVIFSDITFTGVTLNMIDLRNTRFEQCAFLDVDFKYCDLREMVMDGLTFTGVRFDKAALNDVSFKGATLNNVSFIPTFTLTNRYYRAIKTISFEGAKMDKLTYAALKGIGADVSQVSII